MVIVIKSERKEKNGQEEGNAKEKEITRGGKNMPERERVERKAV